MSDENLYHIDNILNTILDYSNTTKTGNKLTLIFNDEFDQNLLDNFNTKTFLSICTKFDLTNLIKSKEHSGLLIHNDFIKPYKEI